MWLLGVGSWFFQELITSNYIIRLWLGRGAFHGRLKGNREVPGRRGRDDAGMSTRDKGENPLRRKPKVSWGRLVHPGLVGPKPRPKGVGDG